MMLVSVILNDIFWFEKDVKDIFWIFLKIEFLKNELILIFIYCFIWRSDRLDIGWKGILVWVNLYVNIFIVFNLKNVVLNFGGIYELEGKIIFVLYWFVCI